MPTKAALLVSPHSAGQIAEGGGLGESEPFALDSDLLMSPGEK